MSIAVQCPGCKSKLNAPPSAAGKKVKCPKCERMLTVPAADDFEVIEDDFEVVDDEPKKPVKAKARVVDEDDDEPPRKKIKKAIVEDDDDDEEVEKPRKKVGKKKGKKKPAPKSMMPLYIGGGVLLAILLGVGGYFAFKGGKKSSDPSKTDWTVFSPPDSSFSASFPSGAPESADLFELMKRNADAGEIEEGNQKVEQLKAMGITTEAWTRTDNKRRYSVARMKFPDALAKSVNPDDVMKGFQQGAKRGMDRGGKTKVHFDKQVTVAGQSAKQMGTSGNADAKAKAVMTVFFANGCLYFLVVEDDSLDDGDAMVQAFLDKFSLGQPAGGGEKKPGGLDRRGPAR